MTRKWGLSPDRDVKLMPIGEPPLMLQALERGVVDATSLSVPASFLAKSKGFFELANYDALGLTYPAARCNHPQADDYKESPDGRESFEDAHRVGGDFQKQQTKEFCRLAKYMRGVSEEFLEDTYQHTVADWSRCQRLRCR
jgi:hypothetical protein